MTLSGRGLAGTRERGLPPRPVLSYGDQIRHWVKDHEPFLESGRA